MNELQNIEIIESWNITTIGIIAELRHNIDGLKSGQQLQTIDKRFTWTIDKRILFHHTLDKQKRFLNESTTYVHYNFGSVDKLLKSEDEILDKEQQNIFQYQLKSIGHNSKLQIGDILILVPDKFTCHCCGYKTLIEEPNGSYEICHVCFWEDDPIQLDDPDLEGGANTISLRLAQKNFLAFKACDGDMIQNVRQPCIDETKDEKWKPLNDK